MTLFSSGSTAEPFLLRFATARSSDAAMPGNYSHDLDAWVIQGDQGEVPLIKIADGSLAATQTKTMTQMESDDDDPAYFGSMETGTYTKVQQEADDEDASLYMPELLTKTEVQQERDDDTAMPFL